MTEQRAHSRFPASSATRLLACPGSFALTAEAPPSRARSSVYAAEGTVAHSLIEDSIAEGIAPSTRLGDVVVYDGHEITVSQEMIDAVQVFLDRAATAMQGAVAVWSEKRVRLDSLWPEGKAPLPMFGTADLLAVHWQPRGRVILEDYKHGIGVPVEVRDNAQLLYYALGAILDLNLLGGPGMRGVGADAVVDTTIVQPRAPHPEGPVRTARHALVDVLAWGYETLRPGVERALEPGAPLNPGAHCRFCPALAICPVLRNVAVTTAQAEFGDSAPTQPEDMSDERVADLLTKIEMLTPWMAAVKDEATRRARAGARIPGWKLVLKRGHRHWTNERAVREALVDAGVPFEKFLGDATLLSPAQVQKRVPRNVWDEHVAPHIGASESPALVRAADPRPALATSPADDFDVVTNSTEN